MITLFCLLILPACSSFMGVFGFWIGRCARKLPIIDDNLPWTLNRSQIQAATEDPAKSDSGPSRWPRGILCRIVHPAALSHLPDIAHLKNRLTLLAAVSSRACCA
jgi:hypothetical protein